MAISLSKELHTLKDSGSYEELFKGINLNGLPVLELGVGTGTLTSTILNHTNSSQIIGYEIDKDAPKIQADKRLDLRIRDFTQEDFSFLKDNPYVFIGKPPYSTLPFINKLFEQYPPEGVLMMVPESDKDSYINNGYTVAFEKDGHDFVPPTKSRHCVMKRGKIMEKTMEPLTLHSVQTLLDKELGSPPHITEQHAKSLEKVLNRDAVIQLLESIVEDRETLEGIAKRSYTHTLGFDKFVLLDPGTALENGGRGYGYQLRLHIWWPGADNGVPLLEAMHEHSFDFVSSMLSGSMENQRYKLSSLSQHETNLLDKLQSRIKGLSNDDMTFLDKQMEALEAQRLVALGSKQAVIQDTEKNIDRNRVKNLLGITDTELDTMVNFQGRYLAVSSGVSDGGYIHRLEEMVKFQPHDVLCLHGGDTYHHPHELMHRLFNDSGNMHSTLLVTTPVSQEAKGGSFQRPTYRSDDVNYERHIFTAEQVRSALLDYMTALIATKHSETFWDKKFNEMEDAGYREAVKAQDGDLWSDIILPRLERMKTQEPEKWNALQSQWSDYVVEKMGKESTLAHQHLTDAGKNGNFAHNVPVLEMMTTPTQQR